MRPYLLLTSRCLALALLIILLGVTGVEVALGLEQRGTNIYGSWWFIALSLLLLCNLLACTIQRFWRWVKARQAGGDRRKRRLNREEIILLGSVFFHLGMAVTVAGVMYDQLTLWRGRLYITETQTINLAPAEGSSWLVFRQGAWGRVDLRGVNLRLDKVGLAYYPDGQTREIRGELTIRDHLTGRTQPAVLRMNYPIRYRGVKFIIRNFGFSPRFSLEDAALAQSRVLSYAYVNLDFYARGTGTEDGFEIAPGMMLWARFYPALAWENGFPISQTTRLDNPWFRIRLEQTASGSGGEESRILHDGWVKLGETVQIGGYRLTVNDIRYWLELEASTERGFPLIVFGLWLGVFGLILRYWPEFTPLLPQANTAAAGGNKNETV